MLRGWNRNHMQSTHNNIVFAVVTQTVMAGDCLEQTTPAMRVQSFLEIDQTSRNGP
jgi:hypothetical protein